MDPCGRQIARTNTPQLIKKKLSDSIVEDKSSLKPTTALCSGGGSLSPAPLRPDIVHLFADKRSWRQWEEAAPPGAMLMLHLRQQNWCQVTTVQAPPS